MTYSSTGDVDLLLEGNDTVLEKKFTYLDLSHRHLTYIPEVVFGMHSLTELNLNHNNLTEIPEEITKLKSLKFLYLSYNKLQRLPDSIGKMKSLVRIDVNNNNLNSLPDSIIELENLKYFDETNNCFESIPNKILDFFHKRFNGTFVEFMSEEQKREKQIEYNKMVDNVFKENDEFLRNNYKITEEICKNDPTKIKRVYKGMGKTLVRICDKD